MPDETPGGTPDARRAPTPDPTPPPPRATVARRFAPGDLATLADSPDIVGRVVAVAVADGDAREAVVYWPSLRATSRHPATALTRPPIRLAPGAET